MEMEPSGPDIYTVRKEFVLDSTAVESDPETDEELLRILNPGGKTSRYHCPWKNKVCRRPTDRGM